MNSVAELASRVEIQPFPVVGRTAEADRNVNPGDFDVVGMGRFVTRYENGLEIVSDRREFAPEGLDPERPASFAGHQDEIRLPAQNYADELADDHGIKVVSAFTSIEDAKETGETLVMLGEHKHVRHLEAARSTAELLTVLGVGDFAIRVEDGGRFFRGYVPVLGIGNGGKESGNWMPFYRTFNGVSVAYDAARMGGANPRACQAAATRVMNSLVADLLPL